MLVLLAGGVTAAESPVIERLDAANAWINWERQVIKAVGVGVLPGDATSPHDAERLAREAAGINAYRNMESAIKMVRVSGEVLVGSVVPEVPEIRLKQLSHSAQVISDRQQCDRSFEVILQVSLSGVAAVLSDQSDVSARSDRVQVIIDARGLDLQPALRPTVFDQAGNEVYSGIARYSVEAAPGSLDEALEVRELTDVVVEGQVQIDSLTILLSPTRESGKATSVPSPN